VPVTLDEIRAVALGLPRAHEGEVRGRVKFYYGRIVFVAMARDETMMGFGFPKDFREAALEAEPDKFVRPKPADLRYNWLVVRLAAIDHDEARKCRPIVGSSQSEVRHGDIEVSDAWLVDDMEVARVDGEVEPGVVAISETREPAE